MRILTIVIAIFLSVVPIFCQMPTDGDYSNWSWEDYSLDNWKRADPHAPDGTGWSRINPPFHPEGNRTGLMDDIYTKGDYKNSDGWELIWARFGPSEVTYPYFILCNKYRGVVRAYIYIKNIPYTKISASLSYHNESKRAGILIYGSTRANATDKYWNLSASDDDMITTIIPQAGTDSWGVAEFPIFFDAYIRGNGTGEDKFKGSRWEFNFWAINNYNIKPADSDVMDPIQNGQHYIVGNSSKWPQTEGSSFDAVNAQLVKDIGDFATLAKAMTSSAKDIDTTSPKFLQDYKSAASSLESFATSVSSKVAIVAAFVKFFKGFFGDEEKNSATQPKATTEQISLKGTMTLALHLGGTTLKVLGVNPNPNDPPLLWQPFDCPIGYLNLKKTPLLSVSKDYVRYPYNSNFPNWDGTQSAYNGTFRKYKLEEDIEIVFNNQIPGAVLEDIKFAFVFNPNGKGPTSFNKGSEKGTLYRIQDEYISWHWMEDNFGEVQIIGLKNPVYDALNKGYFIVHSFNSSDATKTYYGTPFINMNMLKNITFELPSFTDVSLAVLAKIKLNNYSEPIIIKKYYKVDFQYLTVPVYRGKDFFMKNLTEQLCCFPLSEYYQCEIKKTLSTPSTSSYTASEILLVPNFIGNPNFLAIGGQPYPTLGNTIISYPPVVFDCYSVLKSTKNSLISDTSACSLLQSEIIVNLSPNPTSGYFEISSNEEICSIEIINSIGNVIRHDANIYSKKLSLDVSDLKNGIYFLRIKLNSEQVVKKLIKTY